MAHVDAHVTRVEPDPAGLERLREMRRHIAHYITAAVADDARRYCPVDTGELRDSISERELLGRQNISPESDGGVVTVGTDHWAPTEYGSAPHIIRAHGPYSLHNAETDEYFGPLVHHPGTPEQPFMRPAIYQRRELHHE